MNIYIESSTYTKAIIKMMKDNNNPTFYDHPKHINIATVDQLKIFCGP